MVNDGNLTLVEAPLLAPTEVEIPQDQIQQMANEIEEAENMALPDNADDDF